MGTVTSSHLRSPFVRPSLIPEQGLTAFSESKVSRLMPPSSVPAAKHKPPPAFQECSYHLVHLNLHEGELESRTELLWGWDTGMCEAPGSNPEPLKNESCTFSHVNREVTAGSEEQWRVWIWHGPFPPHFCYFKAGHKKRGGLSSSH